MKNAAKVLLIGHFLSPHTRNVNPHSQNVTGLFGRTFLHDGEGKMRCVRG